MDAMQRFFNELDKSDHPPEKKAAGKQLIQRLAEGERIAAVLKDLAEPLGLTPEMIKRHLRPSSLH